MPKSKQNNSEAEKIYGEIGEYYCCPICQQKIHYHVHPSWGEACSRGRVRAEHLCIHGIDHTFISPARKDDPVFIKELFEWNQKIKAQEKQKSEHKQIETTPEEEKLEVNLCLNWLS